jgi:uncharacterized membrane protein YqiK
MNTQLNPVDLTSFTPLEILLMTTVVAVVGGIVILARWFFTYIMKTNNERAVEIRTAVKATTELTGAIEKHNYLIEQLPERLHDKIKAVAR